MSMKNKLKRDHLVTTDIIDQLPVPYKDLRAEIFNFVKKSLQIEL